MFLLVAAGHTQPEALKMDLLYSVTRKFSASNCYPNVLPKRATLMVVALSKTTNYNGEMPTGTGPILFPALSRT
ncbi:hypothetical protein M413DRAFT_439279 [Hebeloma cylindrosporum]|uniref:Uncharacterized protein n=1 Tax=Hebeloma cylindrosporum TaxID=76867 RepID=A0A0C3CFU4_HEBCY|nr:hypothetical protein M413DRAFT_439279 [Hebeloma cylindrosporum h7]